MRNTLKVGVAVALAAATCIMAVGGTASATTGIQSRFAAQAHAAGVSVTKADALQQEVTSFVHEHGGTQVALNVVDFPGGSITFAVPGEKYARDLATTARPLSTPVCPTTATGTFCAYKAAFFEGSEISIYNNCDFASMPWTTEGSYMNHLPTGQQADWLNSVHDVIYLTPASPSTNQEVNWDPVNYIWVCNPT